MPKINEIKISKNFLLKDFECPCCQRVMLHPTLLEKIEQLTSIYKIKITSGYRCEKHNNEVGGVKNSKHLKGMACDITCDNLQEIYEKAQKLNFSYLKIDKLKNYIHLEV